MARAVYYVLGKTLWENDEFSPIAGGFDNKEEAEAVAEEYRDNGINEYGQQNLKFVYKTIVVNTSTMLRSYGWTKRRAEEEIARIKYEQERVNELGKDEV